jgi:acyl-CoA dehydrogenase
MDFTLTEQQQAITDLAGTILGERCPPEVLREVERSGDRTAADAWKALASADLLGLALPEDAGGSELGVLDACLVAEQVGRHVALVPYWPTVAAATAVARWGDAEARRRWLPGALDGTAPLAVALWEPGVPGIVDRPSATAIPDGDGWRLHGTRQPVPWASRAAAVLVPARIVEPGGAPPGGPSHPGDAGDPSDPSHPGDAGDPSGPSHPGDAGDPSDVSGAGDRLALFAVNPDGPGVTVVDETPVSLEPHSTIVLDGAPVGPGALVAGPPDGARALAWLRQRTTALLCATALGVAEQALALTARHVTERHQFGAPIGTFQAVAHRCADAYIDTEAIRLTTWHAVWRLDAGLDADDALSVAAFWVTEGGQRVVHAAQHLHGGIGVDVDYPIHRYFRWAKVLELLVGGATGSLLRLGASLRG